MCVWCVCVGVGVSLRTVYILGAAIICLRCYDWAYSCTPRKWNRRGNQAAIHRHFLCFAIGLQNELWSHNSPRFTIILGLHIKKNLKVVGIHTGLERLLERLDVLNIGWRKHAFLLKCNLQPPYQLQRFTRATREKGLLTHKSFRFKGQ